MTPIFDKNGVAIEPNDVLKVYHFTGARRKKHYMYKLAVLWKGELYGAHLTEGTLKPGYPLWTSGPQLHDHEIVESPNWRKL
jgi:hypothetical protein